MLEVSTGERRLKELNVAYERRDLTKPVLLRLSRKVDPRELFRAATSGRADPDLTSFFFDGPLATA